MTLLLSIALLAAEPDVESWPAFRGDGTSLSNAKDLPLAWDDETNLAWNAPLAGYGQSSPVVWGDRVFVTSSSGEFKDKLHIQCLDLKSGNELWRKNLATPVKIKVSNYVSRCAPTPAVDADRLYAFFESGELLALDHDGKKVLWQRSVVEDYGPYKGMHGLGSSIALTEKAVLVLFQHDGPSYLLAVDKKTGKTLWKIDRPQGVGWNSPIVAGTGNDERIFVSGTGQLVAYSSEGEKLWWVEGIEGNTVASATVTDDYVIVGSNDVGECIAVRRGGSGNVTSSHVAWRAQRAKSSFGSPLVHRGRVYFVDRNGILYCHNLDSGEELFTHRLPSSCWASPVGAGGRVYCFCNDGNTIVVKAGPELEVLATNSLTTEDRVYGVAAVDGAFLVRTGDRLVCVGKPDGHEAATGE